MSYDTGFSRRSGSERDLQPVSIISVDPVSRMAVAMTRTRHTIHINCSFATGDTITVPASGEQWYCERIDNEWRLYGRIPFNDPTLNIKPEEGQVSVGSARGPLELNGPEVRVNGKVFRLNGIYYRDNGTNLERSADQVTWTAVGATESVSLTPALAAALAGYTGNDPDEASQVLFDLGGTLQEVIENFSAMWNELCQNVFVDGLKGLGFGDTDLSKIVSGMQNFVDYLFSIIFCNFDGNLTPQVALSQLRDLLAPITRNPFVLGLQQIADILGVAVGNLLNDAVAGLTTLVELIFNIITCNWDALAEQITEIFEIIDLADGDSPFGPANIIKSIFNLFQLLGSPEINGIPNPIGIFVTALRDFFTVLFESTGNLLEDALGGLVEFVSLIFGILTCDADAITKAQQIIDAITGSGSIFDNIVATLWGVLSPLTQVEIAGVPNPVAIFLNGLKDFYEAVSGNTATNLADGAIGGAVEFVRLIFRVITCSDTNVLADLTSLVDSFTSGYDDPFGILKFLGDLFTSILSNPLVIAIQDFLVGFFPDLAGNSLIQQLIDGGSNLVHLLIKVVTSILPFRALWETLLPFVDWNKVDEMEAVLPDVTSFFANGIADLWKMIFKPIDLIIQGIIPAAGDTAFTDFIENFINFLSPIAEFFTDPTSFDLSAVVQGFLENVLQIVTVDPVTGAMQFIQDFIPAAGQLVANLLAVFGVNFDEDELTFDPITALSTIASSILGGLKDNLLAIFGIDLTAENLNPVTALAAIAGKVIEGLFNIPAAFFTNIITNLTNLFGGQAAFEGGSFNLVTAATYFVNNVLAAVTSTLQGILDTVGSLAYSIAKAIIEVIGKIPLVGAPVAATLTALLEGFVNFGRGTVASGSNLLSDPGAEYASFWTPQSANAVRDTTIKRSAGASLRVTSSGSTAKTFWFNVNDIGEIVPILSGTGEVNYAECYVLYPSTVSGATNAGTSGTVTLVAQFTNSLDEASPTITEQTITATLSKNQSNWVKMAGNFTTPTPSTGFYDRVSFGFRLAANATTSGARFYVDDMLVREISAAKSAADAANIASGDAAAISTNLYGTASRPATTTQVREAAIPTLSQGKVDGLPGVASTVGTLNTTVTGAGGLTTQVGTLNTTVSGTNGLTTQVGTLNGQVSGAGGLIPKLYGGSTVGNQIQVTALPTKLQSVGSGVTLQRTTSNPNPYTTLKVANIMMPWGFYDTNYTSSDFSILNVSGTTMVRASNAGWYQVEMAFGLTRAFSNYPWYFNTILFKNSQPIKYGNGVANIPLTTALGAVYASYVPEVVQSSFIVYLEANEYLAPAYGWRPESGSPNSDTIIIANAPSGSTACITYFSVSLLNRSLA